MKERLCEGVIGRLWGREICSQIDFGDELISMIWKLWVNV